MKTCIILVLCVWCVGCGDKSTDPDPVGAFNPLVIGGYWFITPGGEINPEDSVRLRANVWLVQVLSQSRDWDADTAEADDVTQYAWTSFHPAVSYNVADIVVNDSVLNHANNWTVEEFDGRPFKLNFQEGASTNTLRKSADENFGTVDAVVAFGARPSVINVFSGDTIDRSVGCTIKFTGNPANHLIGIEIIDAEDHSKAGSVGKRFYGADSITLTPDDLDFLSTGTGFLVITRWEMHFLTTSNGAKIGFVSQLMHRVPVRVVP